MKPGLWRKDHYFVCNFRNESDQTNGDVITGVVTCTRYNSAEPKVNIFNLVTGREGVRNVASFSKRHTRVSKRFAQQVLVLFQNQGVNVAREAVVKEVKRLRTEVEVVEEEAERGIPTDEFFKPVLVDIVKGFEELNDAGKLALAWHALSWVMKKKQESVT